MTGMDDAWRRMNIEFAAKLDAPADGQDATTLTVTKYSALALFSEEQLMDAGVIPDTRPPVRIPWHRRLRWRWQAWRERAGRKVGGWIAGTDLSEQDW